MNDQYLTVAEVAKMLKVSYDTALNFVKHNLEHVVVGRQYRVQESKLNLALYPPKAVKVNIGNRPIIKIEERRK